MTPGEKASVVAETLSQALGTDVHAVSTYDRVDADLRIIRGGWRIVAASGQEIGRVGDDGAITISPLASRAA